MRATKKITSLGLNAKILSFGSWNKKDTDLAKEAARSLAVEAARIASGSHCEDMVILDLRGVSPVTDFFVIGTGTSGRQMASVADEICDHGKKVGQRVWHVAGLDSADWIVLDFVDVVVHLFERSRREYYDLELIWGDVPRVQWQDPAATTPANGSCDDG